MIKGSETFFNEPSLRQRSHLYIRPSETTELSSTLPNQIAVDYQSIPRPTTVPDYSINTASLREMTPTQRAASLRPSAVVAKAVGERSCCML